jgi:hypothetical protein
VQKRTVNYFGRFLSVLFNARNTANFQVSIFQVSQLEVWNALQLGKEEKLMRKLKVSKIWIPAFLLAVVMAGRGDADKNAGTLPASGDPLWNAADVKSVSLAHQEDSSPDCLIHNSFVTSQPVG